MQQETPIPFLYKSFLFYSHTAPKMRSRLFVDWYSHRIFSKQKAPVLPHQDFPVIGFHKKPKRFRRKPDDSCSSRKQMQKPHQKNRRSPAGKKLLCVLPVPSYTLLHSIAKATDRFQARRIVQLFPQPLHGNSQCVVIYKVSIAVPYLLQ